MKYCLITFRSVTPAQRAEQLLKRSGYSCAIQRTPRWMEEQGCGYSVSVFFKDVAACVNRLRESEIPFRKVYLQQGRGKPEELIL